MLFTVRQRGLQGHHRRQGPCLYNILAVSPHPTARLNSRCHIRKATDGKQEGFSNADQQQAPANFPAQQKASQADCIPSSPQQQTSQQKDQQHQLRAVYAVPWDMWQFIQVTAAVWVVNMAIPYAVLSFAAQLQGTDIPSIAPSQRELLNLFCQLLQLGSTLFIINSSISKHQPLPKPWFMFELGVIPVFQGLATAIAAVGSGVLLAGAITGHADGQEEWRHLAGLHQDDVGSLGLVLGALVLAPAIEEYYFRGYVLPSLTKRIHPLAAVPLTGLLFASIHPAESFYAEALLGTILSLSLFAADGNLLVPLMAHSLYNTFVLGTEYLL